MASEPFMGWQPSQAAQRDGEGDEGDGPHRGGDDVFRGMSDEWSDLKRRGMKEDAIEERIRLMDRRTMSLVDQVDEETLREVKQAKEKRAKKKREGKKSLALVNIAAGLDGCDDQLLPSSFRALESDLSFNPKALGQITFAQTLALSLSCPVWGYLSDRRPRRIILSVGCFAWGAVTVCLSLASAFWQVCLLRALNGVFLGSVGPISQSMISDAMSARTRGWGFGMVQMTTCIGRVVGGLVTTSLSMLEFHGIKGWRWSFMAVGCLSMFLGFIILLLLDEPDRWDSGVRKRRLQEEEGMEGDTGGPSHMVLPCVEENQTAYVFWREMWNESLTVPTAIIVGIEGVFGNIPWSALSFMTMFMQYSGLSDVKAAVTTSAMLVGAMIGGPIGGWTGDRMHRYSPHHGRPFMGQLALLLRLPLVISTFLLIPRRESSFVYFVLICFVFGLCSIAGVAVNRPIMSDVVRPQHRGTTFAMVIALEGSLASMFGAPLVGLLAEKAFGYQSSTLPVSEMDPLLRRTNADALSKALLCVTTIPWSVSLVFYSLMHITYGADARNAKEYRQSRRAMLCSLSEASEETDMSEVSEASVRVGGEEGGPHASQPSQVD
eukprot:GHVN01084914.1.p1 GENE.GHVN01084914.1~~GHVN01084914.1.p1  ORF type:complete len:605 (+),score=102.26 GHVN01084914.1:91-1905(+)